MLSFLKLFSKYFQTNATSLIMMILLAYVGITQYQTTNKNEEIYRLAKLNGEYIKQIEQEQRYASEMRQRILDMQKALQEANDQKIQFNKSFQSALELLSDELKVNQCSAIPISDNLVKWLSENNTESTTSK
ncbi:hypothetical protein CKF54_00945 [Psittacicella hinzii]|uniref:Uncharacterized protein n=1 Tax=Psittacicella hinzii TaxID=2028575 RepID=A0A3A1YAV9_9GAMM|nr:hypothetical protein [Psittacicella hinzii]RIY34340.1 hypothetical protein CKF54_00945 [Psittacicella hinzii]